MIVTEQTIVQKIEQTKKKETEKKKLNKPRKKKPRKKLGAVLGKVNG